VDKIRIKTQRIDGHLTIIGQQKALQLLCRKTDEFITSADLCNMRRGLRNALLLVAPFWIGVLWWFYGH
jgi:hypothetical protein